MYIIIVVVVVVVVVIIIIVVVVVVVIIIIIVVVVISRGEIKRPDYLPGLTGKTGLERLREEADRREEELAKQIKLGQRVLVQVKKSSKRRRRRKGMYMYMYACIQVYFKGTRLFIIKWT